MPQHCLMGTKACKGLGTASSCLHLQPMILKCTGGGLRLWVRHFSIMITLHVAAGNEIAQSWPYATELRGVVLTTSTIRAQLSASTKQKMVFLVLVTQATPYAAHSPGLVQNTILDYHFSLSMTSPSLDSSNQKHMLSAAAGYALPPVFSSACCGLPDHKAACFFSG